MLFGLVRLLKYTAVGSAVLTFVYLTYALPRLNLVLELRASLYQLHAKLLLQLQGKLLELKALEDATAGEAVSGAEAAQDEKQQDGESVAHAPREQVDAPLPYERNIRDVLLAAPEQKVSFEALMDALSSKFTWFSRSQKHYRSIVLQTLEKGTDFEVKVDDVEASIALKDPSRFTAPSDSAETLALRALKESATKLRRQQTAGGTLQSIVDLTSYISSQTYAYLGSYSTFRPAGMSGSAHLAPAEDDIRREIRSLKSLLLNRRSFIPPRIDHRMNPV
ncbi:hypothetical protein AURDEDRAFT_110367 [Auricularia subglabra TFB-10046 SS5]|nr:hypothetical protein AURDEDRAFT_110367 [Auricularia subglabra TFB-10046 SS5]